LLGLLGTVIGMIEIFGSQAPAAAPRRESGPTGARHFGGSVQHGLRPDRGDPVADLLALLPRRVDEYLLTLELSAERFAATSTACAEDKPGMNFRPRQKEERRST
jgi:biopolymer transport protein ExbB